MHGTIWLIFLIRWGFLPWIFFGYTNEHMELGIEDSLRDRYPDLSFYKIIVWKEF